MATRSPRPLSGISLAALTAASLLLAAPVRPAAAAAPTSGPAVWKYLHDLAPAQRLPAIEREARREGSMTIYGALGIDRANILIRWFNKKYPGIKVNFVRLRESELVDKVLLEHRTGQVHSDLALSSVPWMGLLPPALAPYEPTTWGRFDKRFKVGSYADGWTAIVYELLPQTIAWRTDRVAAGQAPKDLMEMADPKWKGRAGTTTHLESFINGVTTVLGQEKGMALVKKLAALDNRLYRSTAALAQGIAAGEIDVAWNFSAHRPVRLIKQGVPLKFIFAKPLFGVGVTFSVVKGAQHPYAAALFMDYMTTAASLEDLDKAEGGRFFGNLDGKFSNNLAEYPDLRVFQPIPTAKFKRLNKLAEQLFIRH